MAIFRVRTNGTTFENMKHFSPDALDASVGDTIKFERAGSGLGTFQITTHPTKAFNDGQSPYTVDASGSSFTIADAMLGKTITLDVGTSAPGDAPLTGTNGTINVGGGDPDGPR